MFLTSLVSLAIGAAIEPRPAEPYRALVDTYIASFGSCDAEVLKPLFADNHKGFVIHAGMDDGFTAPDQKRQCAEGQTIRVTRADVAAIEASGDFASALLEIRIGINKPNQQPTIRDLRISLMLEDRGEGPRIVRSHIAPLPKTESPLP